MKNKKKILLISCYIQFLYLYSFFKPFLLKSIKIKESTFLVEIEKKDCNPCTNNQRIPVFYRIYRRKYLDIKLEYLILEGGTNTVLETGTGAWEKRDCSD